MLEWSEVFGQSVISALNVGEVVSKLSERSHQPEKIEYLLEQLLPICKPLTASQAIQAGFWRLPTRHLGLSLGDRCFLAPGLELGAEDYTAERVWAQLDLGVKVRVIR